MKKNIYLFCFSFMVTLSAAAQIKKGVTLLGGDINFNSSKSNSTDPVNNSTFKQTGGGFSPSFGKAIQDNLIAGFDLSWSGVKTTQDQGATSSVVKSNNYGAGFFLRKYKTLGSGFSLFLQGRLGGYYNKQSNEGSTQLYNSEGKGYTINLGFYPGVAYLLGKHVQLEAGFQNLGLIGYTHSKTTVTSPANNSISSSTSDNFSLSSGFGSSLNNFTAGLRFLLD
ncbi:hypothetical protein ACX0G9_07885 [Flavitalea flava]